MKKPNNAVDLLLIIIVKNKMEMILYYYLLNTTYNTSTEKYFRFSYTAHNFDKFCSNFKAYNKNSINLFSVF